MPDTNTNLEAIGSAAAGIAHDINNQLTLLLNHLSLSDIDAARDAAGRCCALTNNLLDYSRGETLTFETLDPRNFTKDFVRTLSLPPDVHVNIEFSKSKIHANPLALHRILNNLIANACAAMENDGTIRIFFGPNTITVEDTGPGIAAENLRKIFEPFFTTKGARGTGLGLAIVRDLMRRHGGSVSVTSDNPKRGARFELKFRSPQ